MHRPIGLVRVDMAARELRLAGEAHLVVLLPLLHDREQVDVVRRLEHLHAHACAVLLTGLAHRCTAQGRCLAHADASMQVDPRTGVGDQRVKRAAVAELRQVVLHEDD